MRFAVFHGFPIRQGVHGTSFRRVLLACAAVLLPTAVHGQAWRSSLYPENWQRPNESVSFTHDKLIQDFSFAGYKRGEVAIPTVVGPVFDVTTYGADPTGASDSTVAIQAAINAAAATGGGVVFLPAGEFRVSPQGTNTYCMRISTSNIVLRGAGTAVTFLLNTSYTMNGKTVIQVSPPSVSTPSSTLRNITADLPGPTRRIPVAPVSAQNPWVFSPGQIVRLQWDFTLDWIVENNQQTWWGESSPGSSLYFREVVATNPAEGWIEIDVPTRYALKVRDSASVRTISGLLTGVGVESLAIGNLQHPGTGWGESDYTDPTMAAYDAHNSWLIRFQNVRDSWVSSAHSRQAATNTRTCHMLSNGILLSGSMRITLQNCEMRRPQYGGGGGNGYMYRVQTSNECLVKNSLADFSRHGFVISHGGTSGNVFFQCEDRETQRATGSTGSYVTGGSGSDNHMFFSHSNLWDRCHAHNSFWTAHHRTFSGTTPHGVTSTQAVYWNTSGSGTRYTDIVRSEQLHYGYIIGTSGSRSGATNPTGGNTAPADHLEGIGSGATLSPQSLYLDQLSRRLQPTVIYQGNGATAGTAPVDASSPYQPGDTVTVLDAGNLVKPGFIFTGWNTAPDGSGANHAAGSTLEITGSTFLYAQWLEQPYIVTFNANGGTPTDPETTLVEFGTPYGTLPTTSRPGFSFVGWFTALTGGNLVTPSTPVTLSQDHTLYAQWNTLLEVAAGPDQNVVLDELLPWTPADMTTAAWYDAADASTITASGGTVSQWNDKSGNGNHASQATGSLQPTTGVASIGGLNAIGFTATDSVGQRLSTPHHESLDLDASGGVNIFSVFNYTGFVAHAGGSVNSIMTKGDPFDASVAYGIRINSDNRLRFKSGAATQLSLNATQLGNDLIYTGASNSADPITYANFNGTRVTQRAEKGVSTNTSPLDMGGRTGSNTLYSGFKMGEIIVAGGNLPAETVQMIEGYLAHKWGQAANLAADHPHKQSAPGAFVAVATLNGTVTDVEGDTLTHSWSLVSGPTSVAFANASAVDTTATFTEEGVYTLRLTGHDGFGSNYDELVITVGDIAPTTPTINAWPTASQIVEGQALSAATLSGGSASVPGSFSYNDPSIIPGAGSYPAAVTFAPDDTAAYLTVAGIVDVSILTAFEDWAGGGGITFTGDANGDGVADGLAWLLGAGAPPDKANSLLPAAVGNNGALEANFRVLNQANRGAAVMKLQYGTDLGTWTTVTIPEESGTHDGVDFVITPDGDWNEVKVTVPASTAGSVGLLFMRLLGTP